MLDLVFTNQSLGRSDHVVLEFDYLCYRICKLASTKPLRNFFKADFTNLSSHLAKTIHSNGSVNKLFIHNESANHEADLKYTPRKPIKQQFSASLPCQIRRLLDSRPHLFALQRLMKFAEDIAAYREVRIQCRNEIRSHRKRIRCLLARHAYLFNKQRLMQSYQDITT